MRKIDDKYAAMDTANLGLQIVNTRTMDALPEDEPLFLFRAKDHLVIRMLAYYHELCKEARCVPEHTAGAFLMVAQARSFARAHPERMKVPD